MADKDQPANLGRRKFVSAMTAAGAAAPFAAIAQAQAASPQAGMAAAAEQTAAATPASASPVAAGANGTALVGGDIMVELIQALDIDFLAANPGSSFRGLH